MASATEAAGMQARAVEINKPATVNSVRGNKSSKGKVEGNITCWRCGKEGHISRDKDCPARKAACRNCKLVGNFAKVCKTKDEQSGKAPKKGKNVVRGKSEHDYAFGVQAQVAHTLHYGTNSELDIVFTSI